MVNPGDDDEDIYDRVADELEDRYGVGHSDFEMKMMESKLPPHLQKCLAKTANRLTHAQKS